VRVDKISGREKISRGIQQHLMSAGQRKMITPFLLYLIMGERNFWLGFRE